ncbi:MAG: 30S ribosomal protein S12 methylthiotransferase RimO [Bacillota bacterium]|nr:30S ribosomal protein S12 methylthiotransferase RimO [Bacillota bacterium]
MAIKVSLISLGCPKNQIDSERMLAELKTAGMKIVKKPENSDVAIVNTCGFIESAAQEALSEIFALASLKSMGKLKKIIVTGCLPERYKNDFLSELPEVDFALGAGSYHKIKDAVLSVMKDERSCCFDDSGKSPLNGERVLLSPSYTAYLKIAEGCDNHCAYCVIPSIRGPFRSRTEEDILKEAESLSQSGVKELILVAQDLTRYGLDLYKERALPSLLKKLAAVSGIKWIRLHYLYPDEIDDRLLDLIAENEKILPYFDIPIQHINDRILKSMNRRGDSAYIKALFSKIRKKVPGAVIRTSIIVGLPGETEEEFGELCAFLREAKLPRAGVFPYSMEEGSAAALMENQVDDETKSRRLELVQNIQITVMEEYNESCLGKTLTVLCEGFDADTELYCGRSFADSPEIDPKVFFESSPPPLPGQFVKVIITGAVDSDLTGRAIKQDGELNL